MVFIKYVSFALYLFIVHIFTARRPFVDPKLFKDRNFTICSSYLILNGIMMFGFIALFPALLQDYLGYPVLDSGLILTPRGVATMFASVFVGHILARIGPKPLIFIASILMGTSFFFLARITPDVDPENLIILIALQGISFGFFSTTSLFQPLRVRLDASFRLALSIGTRSRCSSGLGISPYYFLYGWTT